MPDNDMSLKIQTKVIYGKEMIYPMCDKSKIFAQLAGNKTLTHETLLLLKQLGYSFAEVPVSNRWTENA